MTNFNLERSIELLERAPLVYRSLFYGISYDWDKVNEGENTWNAFDILGHLIHGEKTDWIPRATLILNTKEELPIFEPFDRFAQKELSKSKTTDQLIGEFESLRSQNLKQLRSWNLSKDQLDMEGIHPELGKVALRELIATWAIHDLSHLNQITRTLVKHYKEDVGPWIEYSKILNE